jgi:hypothetical protein
MLSSSNDLKQAKQTVTIYSLRDFFALQANISVVGKVGFVIYFSKVE